MSPRAHEHDGTANGLHQRRTNVVLGLQASLRVEASLGHTAHRPEVKEDDRKEDDDHGKDPLRWCSMPGDPLWNGRAHDFWQYHVDTFPCARVALRGLSGVGVILTETTVPTRPRSWNHSTRCLTRAGRCGHGGVVDRIIEHLATQPPAIFITPWLWPIYGLMLFGGFITDRRVHWEKRPRPGLQDFAVFAALLAAGVVSMATGATFPNGGSILWPLLGSTLMAAGLLLRLQATARLGPDFNGDLGTRPDQTVVTSGPYRWVRHASCGTL